MAGELGPFRIIIPGRGLQSKGIRIQFDRKSQFAAVLESDFIMDLDAFSSHLKAPSS